MKNFFTILVIFLTVNSLFAQNNEWQAFMSFLTVTEIASNNNEIICGTQNGLFTYNKNDFSVTTFSKTSGISDIWVTAVAATDDRIFVAYNNLNIDIIENGNSINVPSIKNSSITGEKEIFKIVVEDNVAYFCGTFGIALLDIENKLITETYSLSNGTEQVFAFDMVITENEFAVATNKGVFFADKFNPNLFNVNNWTLQNQNNNLPNANIEEIKFFDNEYFVLSNEKILKLNNYDSWDDYYTVDTLWTINSFTFEEKNKVVTSEARQDLEGKIVETIVKVTENGNVIFETENVSRPDNIIITDDYYFVADQIQGIVKISKSGEGYVIRPNGPSNPSNFDMEVDDNGILWVAAGKVDQGFSNEQFFDKGLYRYDGKTWQNFDRYNLANDSIEDLISVATNASADEYYFGTNTKGLQLFKPTGYKIFGVENSTIEASPDNGFTRVFDADFDANGNLWIANSEVSNMVKMRSAEGDWYSFNSNINTGVRYIKVLATSYNQIWFAEFRNGILVYDYGEDIFSDADDRYKEISTGERTGSLPDIEVKCFIEDLDGEIWVGTSKGISIFFCAGNIFNSENGCDGFEPIVDINGIFGPLLQDDVINDIAVDDANRKWVATGNGVWLLSDDGETVIENFTTTNSPLLSNNVTSVEINRINGEVFFGTDNGIISYKGNATKGNENFNEVNVYPNPVKPDYEGLITIENLKANSNIKITDLNGNLVHEATSIGGKLQWNGMDYTGRKVQSGVYLIYANTSFSGSNYEGKFMILR